MAGMSQSAGCGLIFLALLTAGGVIASIVINVMILNNQNNPPPLAACGGNTPTTQAPGADQQPFTGPSGAPYPTTQSAPEQGSGGGCPAYTGTPPPVNTSAGFKAAADLLLSGLDLTVDPCVDMYQFSCGTYLKNHPLAPGQRRVSTYDMSQSLVNDQIRQGLEWVLAIDPAKTSLTEKITANAYSKCLASAKADTPPDKSATLRQTIISQFNGFPALDSTWAPIADPKAFWQLVGAWELKYGAPSLLSSFVTVDYADNSKNSLYFNQPGLILPRDFYVKGQFLVQMERYRQTVIALVSAFDQALGGTATPGQIAQACTDAVAFETQLALAVVPDDLLRNYKQQWNNYTLAQLGATYPSIEWASYVQGLGITVTDAERFVVTEPAFFGVLDAIIQGQQWPQSTIVNFIIIRLLFNYGDFLGGNFRQLTRELKALNPKSLHHPKYYAGDDPTYDPDSQDCVYKLLDFIGYGAGFVYLKQIPERDVVVADVTLQTTLVVNSFLGMVSSLKWLTDDTKAAAYNKAANLVRNIGWPAWFDFYNTTSLDAYHVQYAGTELMTDWFTILNALQLASQQTENFGLMNIPADRTDFLASPAIVNAWYQPERNSITFPYGILNPPYYRYDFPQAFNYAGQGGTAGHELSHGYDDEGVQFGPTGPLSNCDWARCGWMDRNSTLGFIGMAQCVVSQYSSQCCPVKTGSVHCANGATTQGENIADLAGQQAAYIAYRQYVAQYLNGTEEGRLPGLEQFTPNQIFWITYGYSWCMNVRQASLVNQLLVDPHAPSQCRVNQVMQDIPQFGRDFNCPVGSPMYPVSQDRCKVWTGV